MIVEMIGKGVSVSLVNAIKLGTPSGMPRNKEKKLRFFTEASRLLKTPLRSAISGYIVKVELNFLKRSETIAWKLKRGPNHKKKSNTTGMMIK